MCCWERSLLVGVIHVVVDGVSAATAAGITASGAARSSRRLSRSVVDGVARGRAATLERVVKVHPVTDLVGGGAAQVVGSGATAGHGLAEDGAAIDDEVGRAGGVAGRGEVAVAEKTAAEVSKEVDVQVSVGALSESLLHGLLVAVGGPVGVDSPVAADKLEGDAVRAVSAVHDGELVVQHGLLPTMLAFIMAEPSDHSRSRGIIQ